MTHKILLQQEAELDLQEAFNWYEAGSRGLGSEFIRAIAMLVYRKFNVIPSLTQSFIENYDAN